MPKRGFASMTPERRREVASMGGRSVPDSKRSFSRNPKFAAECGRKGGAAVPPHKRKFTTDKDFAAKCGRKGGSSKKEFNEIKEALK